MTGLVTNFPPFSLYPGRPMDNQRTADATLMLVLFIPPERRVPGMRPTAVICPIAFRIPRHLILAPSAFKRAGTII